MKILALLALSLLFAPISLVAAIAARRRDWPCVAVAAMALASLILGAYCGTAW